MTLDSDTDPDFSRTTSAGKSINKCGSDGGLVHPAVMDLLARKRDMDRDTSIEGEQFDCHEDLGDVMNSDGVAWGSTYADIDNDSEMVAGQSSHVNSAPEPVQAKGVVMYPGCDTIYPATAESQIQEGFAQSSNGPIHVPEKRGVLYPGCDVVYPTPFASVARPEISPEYSTYDPNALPTISTAVRNFSTSSTEQGTNSPTSTLTAPDTSHSLEKQPDSTVNGTSINSTSTTSLDPSGPHPSPRTIRYLFYLRLLVYYRLTIRFITIFISLSVFILTLLACVTFLSISAQQDPSRNNVSLSPHKLFASISGIFTFLSLALNIACCASKRMRRITPLSNILFAVISIAGTFGWLAGCLYLHRSGRSGGGRNLWYYACSAADTYYDASGSGNPALLFRREYNDANAKLSKICNFTQNAWDLGILQICFEILTFINAVVAIILVRMGLVRPRTGRRRNCFG